MKQLTDEASRRANPPSYASALKVEQLTEQALSEQITRIEKAVAKGKAQIDDYLSFVACTQELARRVRQSDQAHRARGHSLVERRSMSRV